MGAGLYFNNCLDQQRDISVGQLVRIIILGDRSLGIATKKLDVDSISQRNHTYWQIGEEKYSTIIPETNPHDLKKDGPYEEQTLKFWL